MNNELDNFGKILISDVRDRTIDDIDRCIFGKYRSENAIRLSNEYLLLDKNSKSFVDKIIPFIVDYSLNNLLEMFEQNEDLELKLNGKNLVEESDGFAGELYTEDGWIQKYTKQRYFDD